MIPHFAETRLPTIRLHLGQKDEEGKYLTTRHIKERLNREILSIEDLEIWMSNRSELEAVLEDRINGIELSNEDANIAYKSISDCTVILPLDFIDFWTPLRS